MKKILRTLALSLLLGIGLVSASGSAQTLSQCVTFKKNQQFADDGPTTEIKKGEKLPQGLDRASLISALLGRDLKNGEAEDIKFGLLRHPTLPEAYILWAWKKSLFYIGVLRHTEKEDMAQDQWIAEPIRHLPMDENKWSSELYPIVFECIPYKLGKLQHVFGLRSPVNGMYSGGGYRNEYLWLFAEYEGKLINVLETAIASGQTLKGGDATDTIAKLRPIGNKPIPDLEKSAITTKSYYNKARNKRVSKKPDSTSCDFVWDENKKSYHSEVAIVPEYP